MTPLTLPPSIDGERILRAIAVVESSSGANNYPRFEVGYAPAGTTFTVQGRIVRGTGTAWNEIVAARWERWGMASACSFSSWQLLFHVAADRGYRGHPAELWDDGIAREWVIAQLNSIAARFHCDSVGDFADAWNSGNPRDGNKVWGYQQAVQAAYDKLGAVGAAPAQ